MKKDKTRENMAMYNIGHSSIEVWAITLMSIASLLAIWARKLHIENWP